MTTTIVAIVGTSLVQLTVLLGAVWSLAGRLARMEERMAGLVTVRECHAQQQVCRQEYEPREPTGVRAMPGGA